MLDVLRQKRRKTPTRTQRRSRSKLIKLMVMLRFLIGHHLFFSFTEVQQPFQAVVANYLGSRGSLRTLKKDSLERLSYLCIQKAVTIDGLTCSIKKAKR